MTATKKNKAKATPDRKGPATKVSGKTNSSLMPKKASAKTAKCSSQSTSSSKTKKITVPQTKPVKKAVAASTAPKRDLPKKTVNKEPALVSKAANKTLPKSAAAAEKKNRFQKSDLDQFKAELLSMRDRITGQSGSMRSAALQRTDETNSEEDGTDAFMRLQTLEQVSTQHQLIANIDEALRAIEKGAYGVCDHCGELISKPRLAVLPFATYCIKCQSEMERSPLSRNRM